MEKKEQQKQERPQLTADLEGNYLIDRQSKDLKAIGLFYAPAGGSAHKVAKRIKQKITGHKVEMFYLKDITPEKLLDYHNIIFVCSSLGRNTWRDNVEDEWAAFIPAFRKISLDGRQVALVGLGDHMTYPNNFADGMGDIADIVEELGGVLIGKTTADGYVFNASRAFRDDLFVGLPLDEDYESDKTNARIEKWLTLVLPEM